jgi:SNF2 family DNA or RNA helicase
MNSSLVSVESGHIRVLPAFVDMLMVQRLGGRFSGATRAWLWPATRENAMLLAKRLRAAITTPEFAALLAPPVPEMEIPAQSTEAPVADPSSDLLAEPPEPDIVVPAGMLTRPWRHQKAAFKFCADHFAAGMRGILLAMGMGTGKSLVACMLILALVARRVLIACPLRVVQVWITQFERHVGVPVILVPLDEDAGSVAKKQALAAEKMKLAQALGIPFIGVINYDSAWRDPFAAWAEKVQWDLVIADEAHRIKAPGGKASLFFKRMRLHAAHRIALTGTPLPHGPMDIYAQFRFLDVTILGPSFSAFRTKHAVMGGYQRKQITGFQKLDELEASMSRITFRVGPEVLDLPPATHVTYYCDLTPEAARIYRDLEEDFVARVKEGTVTAANALVKLLRLQQVVGGCVPTDDHVVQRVDSSKQKLLADTLEDIGKDEAVVVFCRFHADLDAVHQACEAMGYSALELSGRRDQLKSWQGGEAQVLAVQISAGGVGVDFTRARFAMYYSLSFSLGEYDQALARVHRPGQTRPVEHIHLVARNTVDVKIMRALEKRAEIVQSILAEIKH